MATTLLARLKLRMPDVTASDALLNEVLDDAEHYVLAQTGLEQVPEALYGAQLRLAEAFYNRLGTSGETAHTEGTVSRTIDQDLSEVNRELRRYRRAVTL